MEVVAVAAFLPQLLGWQWGQAWWHRQGDVMAAVLVLLLLRAAADHHHATAVPQQERGLRASAFSLRCCHLPVQSRAVLVWLLLSDPSH